MCSMSTRAFFTHLKLILLEVDRSLPAPPFYCWCMLAWGWECCYKWLYKTPDGSPYGTGYYDGTGNGTTWSGKGTAFKLGLDGTLTTLGRSGFRTVGSND